MAIFFKKAAALFQMVKNVVIDCKSIRSKMQMAQIGCPGQVFFGNLSSVCVGAVKAFPSFCCANRKWFKL